MNYDDFFKEDINRKFFFSDYPGKKMVDGVISLKNAKERLNMNEYYTLVTYNDGEELPEQYRPLNNLKSDDGTLFATINSNIRLDDLCRNGSIQMISRLPDLESGSPNYMLGPGPEKVSLEELIMEQYNKYCNKKDNKTR